MKNIFLIGFIWCTMYNTIAIIYNAIENRMWIIKDYEKIIADNLGTYDSYDNKEKMLIEYDKRNTESRNKCLEKRKTIKEKIKKIFSKGKKNDR